MHLIIYSDPPVDRTTAGYIIDSHEADRHYTPGEVKLTAPRFMNRKKQLTCVAKENSELEADTVGRNLVVAR